MDEFIAFVESRESDFIDANGLLEVEFSMGQDMKKFLFLQDRPVQVGGKLTGHTYHWDCFECDTCRGYDPNFPVHCELV